MKFMTTKQATQKWNIPINTNKPADKDDINHERAILFLDDIIKEKEPVTEWNIKRY